MALKIIIKDVNTIGIAFNVFEKVVISNSLSSITLSILKEIGAISNFLSSFQTGQQN